MAEFEDVQGNVLWPFGPEKYKNKRIDSLPSRFLRWVAENSFNDSLATAASEEWEFREKHNQHGDYE